MVLFLRTLGHLCKMSSLHWDFKCHSPTSLLPVMSLSRGNTTQVETTSSKPALVISQKMCLQVVWGKSPHKPSVSFFSVISEQSNKFHHLRMK